MKGFWIGGLLAAGLAGCVMAPDYSGFTSALDGGGWQRATVDGLLVYDCTPERCGFTASGIVSAPPTPTAECRETIRSFFTDAYAVESFTMRIRFREEDIVFDVVSAEPPARFRPALGGGQDVVYIRATASGRSAGERVSGVAHAVCTPTLEALAMGIAPSRARAERTADTLFAAALERRP